MLRVSNFRALHNSQLTLQFPLPSPLPPITGINTIDDVIAAIQGEVAKLGTLILYPPELIAAVVAVIASKESRDVVHNIEVLDGIASTPAPIKLTM